MVATETTYCREHGDANCGCILAERYELVWGEGP